LRGMQKKILAIYFRLSINIKKPISIMQHSPTLRILAGMLLGGTLSLASASFAATPGTDTADQPAYKDGWNNGANGGTGFKPWTLVTPEPKDSAGCYVADTTKVAVPDLNVNGKSFGMFGRVKGQGTEAVRLFDTPLEPGQSFSLDLKVNFRNGQKGFDLRDATGKGLFNLNIGADDYTVNLAETGNGSIGKDYSNNTAFHLTFTQKSTAGGVWTLTRSGAFPKTASGTYSGDPAGFKFYILEGVAIPEDDIVFNNLVISKQN